MLRSIPCPVCKRMLRAPDIAAGQLMQCPACRNKFRDEEPDVLTPVDDEQPPNAPEQMPAFPPPADAVQPAPRRRRPIFEDDSSEHRPSQLSREPLSSPDRRIVVVYVLAGLFTVALIVAA